MHRALSITSKCDQAACRPTQSQHRRVVRGAVEQRRAAAAPGSSCTRRQLRKRRAGGARGSRRRSANSARLREERRKRRAGVAGAAAHRLVGAGSTTTCAACSARWPARSTDGSARTLTAGAPRRRRQPLRRPALDAAAEREAAEDDRLARAERCLRSHVSGVRQPRAGAPPPAAAASSPPPRRRQEPCLRAAAPARWRRLRRLLAASLASPRASGAQLDGGEQASGPSSSAAHAASEPPTKRDAAGRVEVAQPLSQLRARARPLPFAAVGAMASVTCVASDASVTCDRDHFSAAGRLRPSSVRDEPADVTKLTSERLRGIVFPLRTQSMVDDLEPAAFRRRSAAAGSTRWPSSSGARIGRCSIVASACHDCSKHAAGRDRVPRDPRRGRERVRVARPPREATLPSCRRTASFSSTVRRPNRSAALAIAHLLLDARAARAARRCSSAGLHPRTVVRRQLAVASFTASSSATLPRRRRPTSRCATPTTLPPSPPTAPLAEVLGEGAFAIVRRCVLQRRGAAALEVAAKVVSRKTEFVWVGGRSVPSARAYESVVTEVRALRHAGAHANVIRLEEYIEEGERALRWRAARFARAPPRRGVGGEAAAATATASSPRSRTSTGGVVHRDVKLANVLAADGLVRLWRPGHAAIVGARASSYTSAAARSFCARDHRMRC